MAEFVLKDLLKKNGIRNVTVASCATSREEIWNGIGNPVYPPAKAELKLHGISCEGKRAVQLTAADYSLYDVFYCMDRANLRNALRILGSDPDGKVRMLLDGREVSDPWYTDRFDIAYNDILSGCEKILDEIKKSSSR
jgi:protein-tyrosine phosphatase